jgi:hypothetical protein
LEVISQEERFRRGDYTITNKSRSYRVLPNHAIRGPSLLQQKRNLNLVPVVYFVFSLENWSRRNRLLNIVGVCFLLIPMPSNLRIIEDRNKEETNLNTKEMQFLFIRNPNLSPVLYGIQIISHLRRKCYMMDRNSKFLQRIYFAKSRRHIRKSKI